MGLNNQRRNYCLISSFNVPVVVFCCTIASSIAITVLPTYFEHFVIHPIDMDPLCWDFFCTPPTIHHPTPPQTTDNSYPILQYRNEWLMEGRFISRCLIPNIYFKNYELFLRRVFHLYLLLFWPQPLH
jgi:hypothetical protein